MENGTASFSKSNKQKHDDNGKAFENESEKLLIQEIQEGNVRAFKNI
ncbi:MAG: hypothetical protein U5K69_06960 [Balneolaceae bacterium]|nr:hypothetical protein [Balneolaceae bacterium]